MSMWPLPLTTVQDRQFGGVRIVVSEMATTYRKEVVVEKLAIKKRRRGYRVRVREYHDPGAYWCGLNGGYYVMHPAIVDKLKAQGL